MDYKKLLTQVERTLEQIESAESTRFTIEQLAETIAANFRDELGITGGRIYEANDQGNYELVSRFGAVRSGALGIVGKSNEGELGITVSNDYKPLQLALESGVVVMDPNDPGVDRELEARLGTRRFAAIAAGDDNQHILGFDVSPELSREDILFSLNLVRYAMNQRLRAERYESLIVEAQRIQQSILPQRVPQYAGFDIWGKTVPAEVVSGDFYDFIPISDNILGLAIADGSGHGLPAALVVRDIYMGLRMAMDRDFKIIRTMEKLNHIIHRGRLTTKFVSLFYGELETGGILIYSNAGHNYPFLLKGHRIDYLKNGGPVLGPTPDATYTRGFCLYSDGITEAHNARDEEFGLDRLQRLVKANRHRSAEEIGREVLSRVSRWGRRDPDDRTVVIVKAVAP